MFNKRSDTDEIRDLEKICQLEKAVSHLQQDAETMKAKIAEFEKEEEIRRKTEDLQFKTHQMESERAEEKAVHELSIENEKLKAENVIYEKSLKELGFSVTDTKDMMENLIKALGEKSKVNVIK